MSQRTISEIKESKKTAEKKILDIVREFESNNKEVDVVDINFVTGLSIKSHGKPVILRVQLEVDLGI